MAHNYVVDDQMERRDSAEIASSIHTEGMTPRSRRLATSSDDEMRNALLSGQMRFPPNGWWTDGWFYVKNNHVFISIFLAHPSHPYTRGRRFLVLLNSLSFAFFVTSFFQVLTLNLTQTLTLTLTQILTLTRRRPPRHKAPQRPSPATSAICPTRRSGVG